MPEPEPAGEQIPATGLDGAVPLGLAAGLLGLGMIALAATRRIRTEAARRE